MIHNWRTHGAITRFAKITATLAMIAVLAISFLLRAPALVILVQAVVLTAVAAFILSRPAPPQQD